jgi:hypothetical protein
VRCCCGARERECCVRGEDATKYLQSRWWQSRLHGLSILRASIASSLQLEAAHQPLVDVVGEGEFAILIPLRRLTCPGQKLCSGMISGR